MGKKSKSDLKPLRIFSGYGWTTYTPARWTAVMQRSARSVAELRDRLKFDSLAVTGSSGLMAGSVLSVALQMPVIYVRKEKERSHGSRVESMGSPTVRSYLIVDDFVATGNTLLSIHRAIQKECRDYQSAEPECVGAFLYAETSRPRIQVGDQEFRLFY